MECVEDTHLVEHPVYFVSTVPRDALTRYLMQQKLLLALLVASRKLRHYFRGHPIKVGSAYLLEKVLHSPNAAGRVAEWSIELQAFQLEFCTTRVIKGAALVNFVAQWTDTSKEERHEDKSLLPGDEAPDSWAMHFDGAFSRHGVGVGVMLVSLPMTSFATPSSCVFSMARRRLTIKGDSQLLVNFSNKKYKPKDEHMAAYLEEVRKLKKHFLGIELQHIPRGANKESADIARWVSRREPQDPGVFEERLFTPSAAPAHNAMLLYEECNTLGVVLQ
ncbi:uncharacterized protein [Aegilops tauschii subsp. strangulata]|uniref:uncharacterized protein n=1 Tax=Aegilops tauschii subsp. strangulata TaxID=200361 RepID=UPI003CC8CD83